MFVKDVVRKAFCAMLRKAIPEFRRRSSNSVPLRETHLSSYMEIKKDSKNVEQLVRNNPNIKPSEVQSVFVLSAFHQQLDWADFEKEAASAINKKWVSNVKEKVKKDIEPHGHNFEAVVSFKEYCNE